MCKNIQTKTKTNKSNKLFLQKKLRQKIIIIAYASVSLAS